MNNKKLCIIQARVGSTRLPNKVLMRVDGIALLEHEIKRARKAKKIDKLVIATTIDKKDDAIEILCQKIDIDCFRGQDDDVLDRYYKCSLQYPEYGSIVRITGDCPLIDPAVIDKTVELYESGNYDYASNVNPPTFPDGLDVEVFSRTLLRISFQEAMLRSEREHITQFMIKNDQFKKINHTVEQDWSHFRLTVDDPDDFEVVEFVLKNSDIEDGYLKYISLLTKNPEIMIKNMHIQRNEGLRKSINEDKKR